MIIHNKPKQIHIMDTLCIKSFVKIFFSTTFFQEQQVIHKVIHIIHSFTKERISRIRGII